MIYTSRIILQNLPLTRNKWLKAAWLPHTDRSIIFATLCQCAPSPHPTMASRSVQPVLHSSQVWPTHTHTDHGICDTCSNRLHLCLKVQSLKTKQLHLTAYHTSEQGHLNQWHTGHVPRVPGFFPF